MVQKSILQIEGLEADTLLARLDSLESAIKQVAQVNNQPPQPIKEYISRREVAKLFNISLVTVNDWTRKGLLSAYKIGKRVYYKPKEVETALVRKGG